MFRKKQDNADGAVRPGQDEAAGPDVAPPLKPFSRRGSHLPNKPPTVAAAVRHDIPRRSVDAPAPARRYERLRPGDVESKKLTVGRDICLKGEITSCNKLVVEGRVEASLSDARVIEISPTGYFKGSAEVDEADVSGLYEGELIAREILTVRSGGRINGTVRYGRITIEAGGEISGDMRSLAQIAAPPPAPARRGPDAEPAVDSAGGTPADDIG